MKRIDTKGIMCAVVGALLMTGVSAQAQAPADAYRNSQEDISGTARAQAMSGAVGALGADPTAVLINPAGSALYRRGIVSFGFQTGQGKSVTDWSYKGDNTNIQKNYSLGMFNNITYLSTPWTFGGDWNMNWGMQYNRDYSYKREYTMQQILPPSYLGAYIAGRANQGETGYQDLYIEEKNGVIVHDPRLKPYDQIAVLGMNANIIEYAENDDFKGFRPNTWVYDTSGKLLFLRPDATTLSVSERGAKSSYDFNLGFGYRDRFFFGASIRTTSITYSRNSVYDEDYKYEPTNRMISVAYNNELITSGNIVGLNLGAMMALGDYGRIGISYLLPQYGMFEENYYASASFQYRNPNAVKEEDRVQNYRFDTGDDYMVNSYSSTMPGKLTASAMLFLSRYGMVTYDLQYRNLGNSRFTTRGMNNSGVNQFIKEDLGSEYVHRVGLELRPHRIVSLRGGYSYRSSGLKAPELKAAEEATTYEYLPSGTIVDYALPVNYQTYSAGLGLHLGRSVNLDFAYVHGVRSERVYSHPGLNPIEKEGMTYPGVESVGAKMKSTENRFVGTLTFSF